MRPTFTDTTESAVLLNKQLSVSVLLSHVLPTLPDDRLLAVLRCLLFIAKYAGEDCGCLSYSLMLVTLFPPSLPGSR